MAAEGLWSSSVDGKRCSNLFSSFFLLQNPVTLIVFVCLGLGLYPQKNTVLKMPAKNKILACIVLTNYDGQRKGYLDRNLSSFERNLRRPYLKDIVRIFAVDDGSKDNSMELLKRFRDEVGHDNAEILKTENIKAVRSLNHGVRKAIESYPECKYVITFDHDVCLSDDFFEVTIRCAEQSDEKMGMFASNQYLLNDFPNTRTHRSKGHYYTTSGACKDRDFKDSASNQKKEILCACLSGCLIKTEIFDKIGGLPNEEYIHYYTCPEIGFRVRLGGWSVGFLENAIMWHQEPMWTEDKIPIMERNRIWNILRFFPEDKIDEALRNYIAERRSGNPQLLSTEKRQEYVKEAKDNRYPAPSNANEERKTKLYNGCIKPNQV